jgi:hypothetical protein
MTQVTFDEKYYTIFDMVCKLPPYTKIISMNPYSLKLEITISLESEEYVSWISEFIKYT